MYHGVCASSLSDGANTSVLPPKWTGLEQPFLSGKMICSLLLRSTHTSTMKRFDISRSYHLCGPGGEDLILDEVPEGVKEPEALGGRR